MKRLIYKSICIFLCLTALLSAAGCGNDMDSFIVYFEIYQKLDTLDAQLASSEQELMIVRNIYEGLLRQNEQGEIVCAAAKSYEKNGLTYTFTLRDGALWSTGEPLTSYDFLFAFRRAVDPKLNAPFAKRLFAIKNAEKIYKGKLKTSALGVSAPDEKTLVITLSSADEDFEKTLTTSVCMPCNEKFFGECQGQYGLKSNYIISNGSYSLTKWNRDDFGIRIYKNSKYNGDFTAKNGAVFFSMVKDSTPTERLKDNKVDIAFIENSDINGFKSENFTTVSYENICWFLTLGKDYSYNMRKAFLKLVSSQVYSSKLPDGFRAADSLFPDALGKLDECTGVGLTSYDPDGAAKLFSTEIEKTEDKKFSGATLTYYDNAAIKPAVTAIVGHWQQNLSAFVNIAPYSTAEDLLGQLTNPTLSMCILPVGTSSDYLNEYLQYFGVSDEKTDIKEIQRSLLKDKTLIPLAFENTNIVYSKNLKNVFTDFSNGYIDFSFIIKKE